MNTLQNPSFPQPAYGYGNSMGQPETMPQFQSDFSQTQLQQLTPLPNTSQRPPQFAQQPQGQTPSHLYQQYQQQHNQQHPGPSAQLQNRGALALAQGTYYGKLHNSESATNVEQANNPDTHLSIRISVSSPRAFQGMVRMNPCKHRHLRSCNRA